jgi:hypothetical protein
MQKISTFFFTFTGAISGVIIADTISGGKGDIKLSACLTKIIDPYATYDRYNPDKFTKPVYLTSMILAPIIGGKIGHNYAKYPIKKEIIFGNLALYSLTILGMGFGVGIGYILDNKLVEYVVASLGGGIGYNKGFNIMKRLHKKI